MKLKFETPQISTATLVDEGTFNYIFIPTNSSIGLPIRQALYDLNPTFSLFVFLLIREQMLKNRNRSRISFSFITPKILQEIALSGDKNGN